MNKRIVAVALPLMLGAVPVTAQTIVVGLPTDIKSTEFATKHDDSTMAVLHHMVEGLVAYRDDMTVAPNLAESIAVSDDGRAYTFRLREGVTFHNGRPLTSAEVKWSFARHMDPKRDWGSHCRELLDGSFEEYIRPAYVTAVETPDPRTVVFRLQSRNGMFLHHLASNHCIFPVLHPDSVDSGGNWVKPVGTGPFELAGWTKGQNVILRRFAGYKARSGNRDGLTGGKRAQVQSVEFRVIPDAAKARAELAAGRVDLLANVDVNELAALRRPGVRLETQITPAFLQLILQSRTDALMRNPMLRLGIAHAIDRDRLVREAMGGLSKPNPSVVAQTLPQHTAAHLRAPKYDVARARELLQQAGYKNEPIEILASGSPYPIFLSTARATAAMLREAGVNAIVRETDWPTHDKEYGANRYQMSVIAFSTRTDPTLMYSAMVGQKGDHAWYLWEDQEAEMLVTASAIETDTAKRQAMFDRLHAKMIEWNPTIGLANYPRVDAVSTRLKGYQGWTLAIPRLWNVSK